MHDGTRKDKNVHDSMEDDLVPEIGREAELFEHGLVNASMIPDVFGYPSLGENRERINELEEYADEELGSRGERFGKNPSRSDTVGPPDL